MRFFSLWGLTMAMAVGILLICQHVNAFDETQQVQSAESEESTHIAAIKIRVTTNDRELCAKLSRYRPHYPRCQEYCEKLGHWLGMCRRKSFCYCYR